MNGRKPDRNETSAVKAVRLAQIVLWGCLLAGLAFGVKHYRETGEPITSLFAGLILCGFMIGLAATVRTFFCWISSLAGYPCASEAETEKDARKWFDGSGS